MDTLSIVKRIDLRLVELGISKSEFYKHSGISSASYSQWNTGKYNPSPAKLQKASDFLGVSYDYLVNGTPAETKKEPLAINDDEELTELLEHLKNRSEMRMLFQLTKNATKEDVLQAVRIIEALKK